MKKLIKIVLLIVAVTFTTVYAEDNKSHMHGDNCMHEQYSKLVKKLTSAEAQEIAKQEVKKLVSQKKIPRSWKSKPVTKIGKDGHRFSNDWVVVFENKKIKKKDKQILYIFVDPKGAIRGANYTGK